MPYSNIHIIQKPYKWFQSYRSDQGISRKQTPTYTSRIEMLVRMRGTMFWSIFISMFSNTRPLEWVDGCDLFEFKHIAHWTNVSLCNTTQTGPQIPWHWLVWWLVHWRMWAKAARNSETCFEGLVSIFISYFTMQRMVWRELQRTEYNNTILTFDVQKPRTAVWHLVKKRWH